MKFDLKGFMIFYYEIDNLDLRSYGQLCPCFKKQNTYSIFVKEYKHRKKE